MASPTPSSADELRWKEEWPRFRVTEGVVTGVAAAAVATLYIIPRRSPTWGEPVLFDGAIRDAWKYSSPAVQDFAQAYSTWGYYGLFAYPLLIDSGVAMARGSTDVALQMTLINLEAFAVSAFVFRATEATIRRARPYVWECIGEKGNYEACKETGLGGTNSLISGHVAIASTGAALMCTHHMNLKLYGKVGSPVACGLAVATTLGVAYGRIVTDNHYATDVLAAMVVGGLSGWLVPSLLHYGVDGKGTKKLSGLPMPFASRDQLGLSWFGIL